MDRRNGSRRGWWGKRGVSRRRELPLAPTLEALEPRTLLSAAPTISGLTLTPAVPVAGESLTLKASKVTAHGSKVAQVAFYYDSNGDGTLEIGTDTLLGTDTSSKGGWAIATTTPATVHTGDPDAATFNTATFFAVATDSTDPAASSEPAAAVVQWPTIGGLTTDITEVPYGDSITITAHDVAVPEGRTVLAVTFYADTNGVEGLQAGQDRTMGTAKRVSGTDDYTLTVSTKNLPIGNVALFARVTDSSQQDSAIAQTSVDVLDQPPTIEGFTLSPATPVAGKPLTLNAGNVTPRGSKVAQVAFYYDSNGDGILEPETDTLLGTDTSPKGGWTLKTTTPATVHAGDPDAATFSTATFFAVATDSADPAASSEPAAAVVQWPTIGGLVANVAQVPHGDSITITVTDVAAPEGQTVLAVALFADTFIDPNDIGGFQIFKDRAMGLAKRVPGTNDYSLTVSTKKLPVGNVALFARVTDSALRYSDIAVGSVDVLDQAPTIKGFTSSPAAPVAGESLTLSASSVTAYDGSKIAQVAFYYDSNGNGQLDDADQFLGTDTSPSGGWTFTTTTPATVHAGDPDAPTFNTATFFAIATDDATPATSSDPAALVIQWPTTDTLNVTDTVQGAPITLAAVAGNGATGVKFWFDANANGVVDAGDVALGSGKLTGSLEWSLTTSSKNLPLGTDHFIAVATSKSGRQSGAVTATADVSVELEGGDPSLAANVEELTRGELLTLSAQNLGENVRRVSFYDVTGEGQKLVGRGKQTAADQWSVTFNTQHQAAGLDTFTAVVNYADGSSVTLDSVGVTVDDVPPTVGKLAVANVVPRPVATETVSYGYYIVSQVTAKSVVVVGPNNPVKLTASKIKDTDGKAVSVNFYIDTNANGVVDGGDELLGAATRSGSGWSWQGTLPGDTPTADGTVTFLAAAVDNDGTEGAGFATSAVSQAIPTVSAITATPNSAGVHQPVTLTATAAVGSALAPLRQVSFYIDSNHDGELDKGDKLLGNGTKNGADWSLTTTLGAGVYTIFAQASDANDLVSVIDENSTLTLNVGQVG